MNDVTSIRLDPDTRKFVERYGDALGGQIREDLLFLKSLIHFSERELQGKFTVAEACAIVDILNGHMFEPRLHPIGEILSFSIEDGCRLEGLDEKWEID